MAEYMRFRLRAAKAGVTMAFLALLGGLAERASADHQGTRARAASSPANWQPKLSLSGITGNLRTTLFKIEKDLVSIYQKDQKDLTLQIEGLSGRLTSDFYDKHAANSTFLTQEDAGLLYLRNTGTATNAKLLGGLSADAFVQGTGGIATGGVTATLAGGLIGLLHSADNTLSVSVEIGGNGPEAEITNNSSTAIDWVSSTQASGTIDPNSKTTVQIAAPDAPAQVTIQFLPAVQNQAFTLTLSTEPGAVGSGQQRFVGQMINGDG
jgi:hypothetical protein